jgi:hypothetical protein
MPLMRTFTVILVLLVLAATIQLIMPGLGGHPAGWFADDYRPDGWEASQKWVYLLTEALPVLCFALIGTLFWWLGRKTRAEVVAAEPVAVEAAD